MTDPTPVPAPSLLQRLAGATRNVPGVRAMFTCSHRWADGTSAWTACRLGGKGWYTTCARCSAFAVCKAPR